MSAVPKLKEPLDPTKWRWIAPSVYEQQDGIGRLELERGEDDTGPLWTVFVAGKPIGAWSTFRLAKQHAHHLTIAMLAG